MSFPTSTIALSLLAGIACLTPSAEAGSGLPVHGDLLGEVRAASGSVQMGAAVYLYDRYDHLARKALTTDTGKFIFTDLTPDMYSIRVVLASFETAFRRNIAVAAGSPVLLKINLSSILSNVELVPASATAGILMNDEWKWVLRASQSTRPVLRLVPVTSSSSQHYSPKFTETTGVVRLSAGDGDEVAGTTAQEMGTAFALATVLDGINRVRLSGDFGYLANSGLPTAGFRTTYSRDEDGQTGPKVSVTVHQIYFPGNGDTNNLANYQGGATTGPVLRTVSAGIIDKMDVNDHLRLEYGSHFDTVSFLERINRASPFARATYDLGEGGSLRVAFSAGSPPQELLVQDPQSSDLSQDLNALAMLPRVSSDGGDLRLQRTQTWEAGYRWVHGSRRFSAGAYSESVRDAAFTMTTSGAFLTRADLLPDLDSGNYVFDIGDYNRIGYDAAMTQSVGDNIEITLAGGRGGALIAPGEAAQNTAADARTLIHPAQRVWATARAAAKIPGAGTHLTASYGWTDFRALMPAHLSLTGDAQQEEGWNLSVRQPLPGFNRHGRLEATGELRNALAQGYLPLNVDGHSTVLTNAPRTLRGGLAFLF